MSTTVKRKGITPVQMLEKCKAQWGQDFLTAIKEETRRSYHRTGYLADNLRVEVTKDGGRIIPPDNRLDAPQTRNGFLERVYAKVAATFLKRGL